MNTAKQLVNSDPVVVTGIGGISSLGLTKDTLNAIFAGKSGIGPLDSSFAKCETCIGGIVTNLEEHVKAFYPKDASRRMRRSTRTMLFAQLAATEALIRAGFIKEPEEPIEESLASRVGCSIGTGVGPSDLIGKFFLDYARLPHPKEDTYDSANKTFHMTHLNTALLALPDSSAYGNSGLPYYGPTNCSINACATGAGNIREAWMNIVLGFADVMIAGGTEKIVAEDVKMFNALGGPRIPGALSHNNDNPEHASRPFDKDADGFVPSEGAWILVLERLSHAVARKASILAVLKGFGSTTDGTGSTDPSQVGQAAAMRLALELAGVESNQVDLVVAHGTATETGDPIELLSIKEVLGESRTYDICAPKSEAGHLLGAAASLGAAVAIEAIRRQEVPPTINLKHLIDAARICKAEHSHGKECYLSIPTNLKPRSIKEVLSNAFGFGGQNICTLYASAE